MDFEGVQPDVRISLIFSNTTTSFIHSYGFTQMARRVFHGPLSTFLSSLVNLIFQHRQRQLLGDTMSAEPIGNARMGNGDTPGTALLVIHRCRSTAQIEFITSERLIILQFILFHNHRILIVCKEEQNPHRNPHFGKEKTGPGDLPGPVSQSARIGYALPADPRTFSHLCM